MKKKMNISINTLNGYFNYGNRLQLFALSKIIANYTNNISVYWPKNYKLRIKLFLKHFTPLAFIFKKENKLRNFTKKHIPSRNSRNAGIYIYGSDQVWNPRYLKKYPYLLENSNRGNLKISYAASLGVSELTNEQKELFTNALKEYKSISVREQSAKKLLQPLTDKKIEVVLDPTLLLDKNDYEKIEQKPKNLKKGEKYVLCYILGNRENQSIIEKYAKKHNLKVILFSDKKDSDYGVEEFLYLIHHAEFICTDSFHACVFSFIFERPFVAFRRSGEANYMYTRLQNLIDTFKLKNREFNGRNITKENLEVDFSEAKKILKKEQEKSINFLKKALNIKDEN